MSRRLSWPAGLALLALSMMSVPAQSQSGVSTINCFGRWFMSSCVETFRRGRVHPYVIKVPGPTTADETAAIDARDRRWVERCGPVVRQDRYGMPRYSYAAQGCEFGRLD